MAPRRIVPHRSRADPTLVKALARAFRWKRLLENGTYASISEMAAAEKIDRGYLGRVLLLTLLAPDMVEAILDGRLPELSLPRLMQPFPLLWSEQRRTSDFLKSSTARVSVLIKWLSVTSFGRHERVRWPG